jgi:hypothetical protein
MSPLPSPNLLLMHPKTSSTQPQLRFPLKMRWKMSICPPSPPLTLTSATARTENAATGIETASASLDMKEMTNKLVMIAMVADGTNVSVIEIGIVTVRESESATASETEVTTADATMTDGTSVGMTGAVLREATARLADLIIEAVDHMVTGWGFRETVGTTMA